MDTIIADRIRRTGSHAGHLMTVERPCISMFIQVLIQFRKSSLLTRINAGSMITITDTKLIVENKRSTGAERYTLLYERTGFFNLGHMTKICCRKEFKIISSANAFTLVSTTIVQVKKMIGSVVIKTDHISYPRIMSGRSPELYLWL